MRKILEIEKFVGETPLEALERTRSSREIPAGVPMCYAGRLDPMATGKLLVLVADACKDLKKHCAYDKEYVVDVLLGMHSDTGDVLGLVELDKIGMPLTDVSIKEVLASFVGPYTSDYPAFSSKTVRGKPLFLWKLENRMLEIQDELPRQHGTIRSNILQNVRTLSKEDLLEIVRNKIALLPSVTDESKKLGQDFRRVDVLESWDKLYDVATSSGMNEFSVLTIRVRCSSGVYMRTLADDIGKKLGTRGLALSIHRTRIFYPLYVLAQMYMSRLFKRY